MSMSTTGPESWLGAFCVPWPCIHSMSTSMGMLFGPWPCIHRLEDKHERVTDSPAVLESWWGGFLRALALHSQAQAHA